MRCLGLSLNLDWPHAMQTSFPLFYCSGPLTGIVSQSNPSFRSNPSAAGRASKQQKKSPKMTPLILSRSSSSSTSSAASSGVIHLDSPQLSLGVGEIASNPVTVGCPGQAMQPELAFHPHSSLTLGGPALPHSPLLDLHMPSCTQLSQDSSGFARVAWSWAHGSGVCPECWPDMALEYWVRPTSRGNRKTLSQSGHYGGERDTTWVLGGGSEAGRKVGKGPKATWNVREIPGQKKIQIWNLKKLLSSLGLK